MKRWLSLLANSGLGVVPCSRDLRVQISHVIRFLQSASGDVPCCCMFLKLWMYKGVSRKLKAAWGHLSDRKHGAPLTARPRQDRAAGGQGPQQLLKGKGNPCPSSGCVHVRRVQGTVCVSGSPLGGCLVILLGMWLAARQCRAACFLAETRGVSIGAEGGRAGDRAGEEALRLYGLEGAGLRGPQSRSATSQASLCA